jgi:predicted nuclease of predicted toxin-antitoxin system
VDFLADESCDFAVVRALRRAAHDVVAVAEASPRAADDAVLAIATHSARILLTEDKDFGRLVYAQHELTGGVIFIRFPAAARQLLPPMVLNLVQERGADLKGRFVVIQPGRIRLGPMRTP